MTHWQSTELGVWQCKGKGKGTKDTWSPGKFADKGASKGEAGKGKEHQRNGEGAHLNDRRAPSHNANQPVDEPGLDTTEQEVNNMEHYVNPQETPGNAIDDLQNPTPVDSTAVRRTRFRVRNLPLHKTNHVVATEEDDYGNWLDLVEEVTYVRVPIGRPDDLSNRSDRGSASSEADRFAATEEVNSMEHYDPQDTVNHGPPPIQHPGPPGLSLVNEEQHTPVNWVDPEVVDAWRGKACGEIAPPYQIERAWQLAQLNLDSYATYLQDIASSGNANFMFNEWKQVYIVPFFATPTGHPVPFCALCNQEAPTWHFYGQGHLLKVVSDPDTLEWEKPPAKPYFNELPLKSLPEQHKERHLRAASGHYMSQQIQKHTHHDVIEEAQLHTAKEPRVPADSEAPSPATGNVPIIRSDSFSECADLPTIQSMQESLDKANKELRDMRSQFHQTKKELQKAYSVTQGLSEREVSYSTRLARLEGQHDRRSHNLKALSDRHDEMEDRLDIQQAGMVTWTEFQECLAHIVNHVDQTECHIQVTSDSSMLQPNVTTLAVQREATNVRDEMQEARPTTQGSHQRSSGTDCFRFLSRLCSCQ